MERDTVTKKIIFSLLDALLIIGSILSVLTINRGEWLISNPAFYTPPAETVEESLLFLPEIPR